MSEQSIKAIVEKRMNSILAKLPTVVGNEALKFTQERFIQQDWLDNGSQPWQERSAKNKKNQGRKILVKTGRLFRSPRIIETGTNRVVIGVTDVPYAAIHNYGGEIHQAARSETFARDRITRGKNKGKFKKMKVSAFRAGSSKGFSFKERTIRMPKRQFIGNSPELRSRLVEKAQQFVSSRLK